MSSRRVTLRSRLRAHPLPAPVLHHPRGHGRHALVRVRAPPGGCRPRRDDGNRGPRARPRAATTSTASRWWRSRAARPTTCAPPASRSARRIAGFGGFAAAATAAAVRLPRPDVVFATSPALTVAVPGLAAARRHRAPLVFEVRDLWPRAPIEMGALRNPAARALARGAGEGRLPRRRPRGGAVARHARRRGGGRRGPGRRDADPQRRRPGPVLAGGRPGRPRRRASATTSCARTSAPWARPTTWTRWCARPPLLADRGQEGVTFALMGDGKRRPALEEEVRRRGAAQRGAAARGRQGRRCPAGRRLRRLPDRVQGRAGAGHQLAQQAVRHVRRRARRDREHRRLAARAGGGQPGRRVRAARPTPRTWPRACWRCATIPS